MEIFIYVALACMVLGVFGIIFFISYFFTAIGKNTHLLKTAEKLFSVESLEFLYTVSSITKSAPQHVTPDDIEIISTNEVFYKSLLSDIENAQQKISIVTYVWADDESTNRLFSALKSAVHRGVAVRLLIDSFGSSIPQSVIDDLSASGMRVEKFRPFQIGKISQYSVRTHRRSFVFDDMVAYIGGGSLARTWLKNTLTDEFTYHDMMYRCTGNSVLAAISAFHELWISVTGEVVQLASIETFNIPDSCQPNFVSLVHTPQIDIHPFTYVLWYSLMCARKEIIMCSPYFVPGRRITDVLIRKARAGIKIKLITQGTDELWFVRDTARQYYDELIAAGIEIYEYQIPHLHAKVIVVDRVWTLFGSANVDIRSQRINHENIFCIQNDEIAVKNLAVIDGYLKNSIYLKKTHWQKWPWWRKIRAKIIKNFSEQF